MVIAGATHRARNVCIRLFQESPVGLLGNDSGLRPGLKYCSAEAVPKAHPLEPTTEESRFLKELLDFGKPLPLRTGNVRVNS